MSTIVSEKIAPPAQATLATVEAANFFHLYWDVAWFGVVFGSTLSFLSVFAARLGAAGWQIGLLSAGPALVNVLVTLPAGRWLAARPLGRAVVQTAFWQRLGFFLIAPLPLLLPASLQVWAVLVLILLMAIPGAALAIGFNALLATTVPPEARGKVVGWRNSLLAATVMVVFVLSGWILDQVAFAWGYAMVFGLGALGASMSTYHLSRIQVPAVPDFQIRAINDQAQPGRGVRLAGGSTSQRLGIGLRLWLRERPGLASLSSSISSQYRWVMLAFFLFHFTQLLPAALFPLFWVREARLTDGEIGWVNGVFYLAMLIASPFLGPFSRRLGNYRLTVGGAILLALYPLLVASSYGLPLLLVASVFGGINWAILSGSLGNRLLEVIPEDKRPAHLALYNLALNVATLSGIMLGPFLANLIGLRETLVIIVGLRVISGLALARWG